MKTIFAFASASAALFAFAATANAAPRVQQMIYNVDAAAQCSQAAAGIADAQHGQFHCDTALRDPAMTHRAELLVDRGIVKARQGDVNGAIGDYNQAIAENPQLGDAYVNRGAAYIIQKRYGDAWSDVTRGIELGASNMAAALFSRAAIEDDRGDYQAAYRDYKQALVLKPDYTAASRELARFKVTRRTADAN